MNPISGQRPEFFEVPGETHNPLWQYVQAMGPEAMAQLSRPVSQEVVQMMEASIVSLLGALPGQQFDITITTSRDHLGRLLASAMMSGYFLRGAEQRLAFESALAAVDGNHGETP